MVRLFFLVLAIFTAAGTLGPLQASAQTLDDDERWEDVGATGFDTKRLVLASACSHACPWGELGEFVRDAAAPAGYEVILCRNCNRMEGPRVVGRAGYPPALVEDDIRHGTTKRVKAPIDFGITEASMMKWAYEGKYIYEKDGPYPNLRLIAHIEDPTYLLVAVKPELGIRSLAEVRERKLPVRILTTMQPTEAPVLAYYGLDQSALESWGGSIITPKDVTADTPFDVVISSLASPANNPESAFWTTVTVAHDLHFLELPQDLRDQMVRDFDMVHTKARWGVLRGVDREILSVGRSGEVIFARDDMPEDIAYALARAVDENRRELKWFVRPYSIDPATIGNGRGVPVHPGAERYYREMGYLK